MTPLRQSMIDAMVLRGFSPRTQESYADASAIRLHSAIVQGFMPVRNDVDWLKLPQARS